MKKIIFGTMIAFMILSCSNEPNCKDKNTEVNLHKIESIETKTKEVDSEIDSMHQEVEQLKQEIDELLNDI